MSNFKIVLTGVFIFFIVLGVIVFATFRGSGGQKGGTVVLWGTFDRQFVENLTEKMHEANPDAPTVSYVQKKEADFDHDLVEALASGKGPDVFILPGELALKYRNKVTPIPFESLTERDFKNNFVEEGELFLESEGIEALPFAVDPLIMYWNRDILSDSAVARAPSFWEELGSLGKKLTIRDKNGGITQSAVSLGEYGNVSHAKEIVSALFFQAGLPVILPTLEVSLSSPSQGFSPGATVLSFYTDFANPTSPSYSWNLSLPASKELFASNVLGLYLGFGSEYGDIRKKNPNLNFDVALFPQLKSATKKVTFGQVYGLAISSQSKNVQGAYTVVGALTGNELESLFSEMSYLAPARRDVLGIPPQDPVRSIIYSSALLGHGFPDPDPQGTRDVFKNMIESITSGALSPDEALNQGRSELNLLLRNYAQ